MGTLKNKRHGAGVVAQGVKLLTEMPTSHIGVPGLSPAYSASDPVFC